MYTIEGDVIPQLFFRQKPLLSDGLPDWCKSRLDDFLSQKKREGWESSTIAMYRSCATRFCLYLCAKGFASFSDVSAATVTAFNRADKHLSAEGKNAYNVRIRNFLQFLERNGDMPYGIHKALFCIAAKNEKIVTVTLPGSFLAFPGDTVTLELNRMGLSGVFRVAETRNRFSARDGARITLTLKERL